MKNTKLSHRWTVATVVGSIVTLFGSGIVILGVFVLDDDAYLGAAAIFVGFLIFTVGGAAALGGSWKPIKDFLQAIIYQ